MKIGLYTDVHFCSNSSIIRSQGYKYSTRLENCVRSINWAEKLFKEKGCEMICCLGDFFDRSTLNAEELTALNDIEFCDVIHHFLVGNHEINRNDNAVSSAHVFNNYENCIVCENEDSIVIGDCELCLLPYTSDPGDAGLYEYFSDKRSGIIKRVILSHNDIKGINYGYWTSDKGFELEDIKSNCDLFINGHLHNSQFLDAEERVLNLGNLTGQNFGEDATIYNHYICILDTNTLELEFIENPHAYNFYKLDLVNSNLSNIKLKANAVVRVRVDESSYRSLKEELKLNSNIAASKITVVVSDKSEVTESIVDTIDHLKLFKDFIIEKLESTKTLKEEVSKILEG